MSVSDLSAVQWVGVSLGAVVAAVGVAWLWKRQSALYEISTSIVIDTSAQHAYDVSHYYICIYFTMLVRL